jgi:hypothetical protein
MKLSQFILSRPGSPIVQAKALPVRSLTQELDLNGNVAIEAPATTNGSKLDNAATPEVVNELKREPDVA